MQTLAVVWLLTVHPIVDGHPLISGIFAVFRSQDGCETAKAKYEKEGDVLAECIRADVND